MSTQHSRNGVSSGAWLLLSRLEPTAHEVPTFWFPFRVSSISSPDYSQRTQKPFPRALPTPVETAIIYSSSLCPLSHLLFLLPTRLLPNPYQDLSFTVTSASDHPIKTSTGITYHITVISLTALLRKDLANSTEKG